MMQFCVSKSNLCQRNVWKLKAIQFPPKRNFSLRTITKPILTVKTKVCLGVITFSTCAGYIYSTELKDIKNLIPTGLSRWHLSTTVVPYNHSS